MKWMRAVQMDVDVYMFVCSLPNVLMFHLFIMSVANVLWPQPCCVVFVCWFFSWGVGGRGWEQCWCVGFFSLTTILVCLNHTKSITCTPRTVCLSIRMVSFIALKKINVRSLISFSLIFRNSCWRVNNVCCWLHSVLLNWRHSMYKFDACTYSDSEC